jgi:hypothetical protein
MKRRASAQSTNSVIAGLLGDLAALQLSRQSRFGYARAADAIAVLPAPIESYLRPDGTLRKIDQVGPSSTRLILKVLRTGKSPMVGASLKERGKAAEGTCCSGSSRPSPGALARRRNSSAAFLTSVAPSTKGEPRRSFRTASRPADDATHFARSWRRIRRRRLSTITVH